MKSCLPILLESAALVAGLSVLARGSDTVILPTRDQDASINAGSVYYSAPNGRVFYYDPATGRYVEPFANGQTLPAVGGGIRAGTA
jgi:hypothetical protein